MLDLRSVILRTLLSTGDSRSQLLLENLALRHQIAVLQRTSPREQKLTAPRCPWQNSVVERFIGSIRRECLDHVIIFNAGHLRRLLSDYLAYYHGHRPHRVLDQDSPEPRAVEPSEQGNVVELPLVNGLHHRSSRQAA